MTFKEQSQWEYKTVAMSKQDECQMLQELRLKTVSDNKAK